MSSLKHTLLLGTACWLFACGRPEPSATATASATPKPGAHSHKEDDGHKHEHEEGGEGAIEFKPEQIKLAGIVAQKLGQRNFRSHTKLPATIVGDPDREVKVAIRVEGIVENLYVRVGDRVSRGQVLATLGSTEIVKLQAEYQTQAEATRLARQNLDRRLRLNRVGDVVRRPLEEAQREVAQAQAQIEAARANVELNRSKLDRLEELRKDGIASLQQVEEARAAHRESVAKLDQALLEQRVASTHLEREQRLKRSGLLADNEAYQAQLDLQRAEQAERAALKVLQGLGATTGSGNGTIDLVSPRKGVVTERPKAQGEHVAAGDSLLTVVDTESVWAWVDLPAQRVDDTRLGTRVEVSVQGLDQRTFQGTLTFITPQVDPDTKKSRARLELANPDGQLRPNMFAEVLLPLGSARQALSLPQHAVVSVENQSVVYVQAEPGHYQRHPVVIGEKSDGWVEIKSGLEAGEMIVVKGVLALQAEDLKASMGEGGHQH